MHQERKIQDIVDDLEEMEEEIPVLEIDESLKDGTDYKDPAEEKDIGSRNIREITRKVKEFPEPEQQIAILDEME